MTGRLPGNEDQSRGSGSSSVTLGISQAMTIRAGILDPFLLR